MAKSNNIQLEPIDLSIKSVVENIICTPDMILPIKTITYYKFNPISCYNCKTKNTSKWRINSIGKIICNAC